MTDKELQEILDLHKAASGHMKIVPNHYTPGRNKIFMGAGQEIWIGTGSYEQATNDYEYIVKACNSALEMVKEIKQLQKMVDWLAQDIAEREKEAWECFCDPPTEQFEPWFWIGAARKASQNEA